MKICGRYGIVIGWNRGLIELRRTVYVGVREEIEGECSPFVIHWRKKM